MTEMRKQVTVLQQDVADLQVMIHTFKALG